MEIVNKTRVQEFFLLGFPELHQYQILLFTVVLLSYILCVLGNMFIIILVKTDPSLHSPMYLFISMFAVLDIGFITTTVPKLLAILITTDKRISFVECFAQLFAFDSLGVAECYLLIIMSFDRDLAINNPLHYPTIMTKVLCVEFAVLPSIISFFIACVLIIATVTLDFCGPNKINHFFCDLPPLQNLACSSSFISKVLTITAAVLNIVFPFITIMLFYVHIINTVLKIKGSEGRRKAFSTCSSHLIVALLFFGTALVVYISAKGNQYDKYLALLYTVLTPLLNPFIYTLRNQNVKEAAKKLIYQNHCFRTV